ncbi:putative cystine transporter YijE [Achromobacter ruhlandii]|uniref:Cystine transporter YijE n=1 Tax=Achromobacter ruhlandii TaxID=72557 RepID=A0ABM8LNG4_9BURK|nr:Permease of the drug/metabolite transporter (DMT) superfamily [Achromobacter xylosoxidans]AOU91727.1 DMT superfamily drug/metabolite transporter permease [Achromobacter ruhlandii]CAB3939727.1 putative cystine transporter YijE [Achromobacter ruhlandii]
MGIVVFFFVTFTGDAAVSRSSFDRAGLALMFSTILVWAGSWIAMKLIVPYIGPFDFVALRYVTGALVLFALAAATRRPLGLPSWKLTLLIGLTQTAGFQGFVQTALVSGGVGKVSLMAYTMPFWVVLFAWGLLGERPTARHGVGIGLAAIGLVLFIEPWHGVGEMRPVLLGLGSGLCWGVGTVLSKRLFERHAPDVMTFTAWQMLFGGLVMTPVAWLVPQIPAQWGWQLWTGMVYIVLIATAAGWLLWLQVVRRVPASIAGLSSLGVPVVAMLMAWAVLSERPSPVELGGMALILAGIFVVSRAAPAARAG